MSAAKSSAFEALKTLVQRMHLSLLDKAIEKKKSYDLEEKKLDYFISLSISSTVFALRAQTNSQHSKKSFSCITYISSLSQGVLELLGGEYSALFTWDKMDLFDAFLFKRSNFDRTSFDLTLLLHSLLYDTRARFLQALQHQLFATRAY